MFNYTMHNANVTANATANGTVNATANATKNATANVLYLRGVIGYTEMV